MNVCSSISYVELPLTLVLSVWYRQSFTWGMVLPCVVLYMCKECYCMSVCLHRYFSHKAFKCSRCVQFILSFVGCLASQGSPLWWASKHRKHHQHCDTHKDPHTPQAFSLLYAWIGWIYWEGPLGRGVEGDYIRDLTRFPELHVFEVVPWAPVYLLHYVCYSQCGVGAAVFVSMWSSMLCQLLTLYFNVMFHKDTEVATTCKAADMPHDVLSNIFGEAYHKHHHLHPRLCKRPGLDVPYWTCIYPLKRVRIFRDVS